MLEEEASDALKDLQLGHCVEKTLNLCVVQGRLYCEALRARTTACQHKRTKAC
jgi:hypothetical protein